MVSFNGPGLVFLITSFALTCWLSTVRPAFDGDPFLFAWALMLGTLDLVYRAARVRRKLAATSGGSSGAGLSSDVSQMWPLSGLGGSVMYLPAWVFSILAPLFYVFIVQS